MAFVRTFLVILALLLSWGAMRIDPALVFGVLGCALPMMGRPGAWRRRGARQVAPIGGGLALS